MDYETLLLAGALAALAILLILGLLLVGRTVRQSNAQLLPLFSKDIERGEFMAKTSVEIAENLDKRLAMVFSGLARLQHVVEEELRKKKPVFYENYSQTPVDRTDTSTQMTPPASPRGSSFVITIEPATGELPPVV